MPDTNNTDPILLPTPVAVVHQAESKFSVMAKFLAWLTALSLSVSVLVALVSVTNQRNDLQKQLSCRAAASFQVNKAIVNEQIALAKHNVAIGYFVTLIIRIPPDDPTRAETLASVADHIEEVDSQLSAIGDELQLAVAQQQVAISAC